MIDPALAQLLPHRVIVCAAGASNEHGGRTFGSPRAYRARVVDEVKNVQNVQGEEVVSMRKIWLDTTDAIATDDLLILPNGFTPQRPPIISVQRVPDENGLYYTALRV